MPMGNPHLGEMADGEDPRVKPEDDVEGKPEDDGKGQTLSSLKQAVSGLKEANCVVSGLKTAFSGLKGLSRIKTSLSV